MTDNNEQYDSPEPFIWNGDAPDFRSELSSLLNRFCKESKSNTPDFLLRDFLCNCLAAYDDAVERREEWHGRDPHPKHTRYGIELESGK